MRHRSPGRWLAPLALVLCVVAVFVVVRGGTPSARNATATTPAQAVTETQTTPASTSTTPATTPPGSTPPATPSTSTTPGSTPPAGTSTSTTPTTTTPTSGQTYVVRPGDVLSAIAVKTGVSVADLQRLNPTADPSALQPGQTLR